MPVKMRRAAFLFLVVSLLPRASFAQQQTGDLANGADVFAKQCAQCHGLGVDFKTGLAGPPLNGIVGRRSAQASGFNYSPQMRSARLTWDAPMLARYLKSPKGTIPGTRMLFNGLTSPKDISDVIALLETYNDNGARAQ